MTPQEEREVVETHKPFIMKHALRAARTSGREVDDCAQDAYVAFLEACRDWRPEGGANIRTFATPYLQHAAIKAWKCANAKKRKHVSISLDAEVETEEGTVLRIELATFATPALQEQDLDAKRHAAILRKAISRLSPRHRSIIELRFDEGLKLRDVGEVWGLTRERIRQLEVEALGKLRDALARQGVTEL